MVLSTAALTGTAALVGEEAFLAWGWRVPFLLSIVLLAVGLFVRMRVEETPVFAASAAIRRRRAGSPLLDVLRNHPRNLLLAVGVGLAAFVAQANAHDLPARLRRPDRATSGRRCSTRSRSPRRCAVFGIIGWSALSDRLGRRPVVLAGAAADGRLRVRAVPDGRQRECAAADLALVLGQSVIHPMMYGPLAALYSELFSTRNRYTGASLGYQLAGMGAGLAPLLFARGPAPSVGQPLAISLIIAAFCVLTVVCMLLLGETSGTTERGEETRMRRTPGLGSCPPTGRKRMALRTRGTVGPTTGRRRPRLRRGRRPHDPARAARRWPRS